MRTGSQNLLYPSTLGDPAASASGVGDRRPAVSPLAGRFHFVFTSTNLDRGPAQAGIIPGEFSTPALEQKTTRSGTVRPSAPVPSRSLRRLIVDFRSEKPVHGGLSATTRLRSVPWCRLPAGRARRPCE